MVVKEKYLITMNFVVLQIKLTIIYFQIKIIGSSLLPYIHQHVQTRTLEARQEAILASCGI